MSDRFRYEEHQIQRGEDGAWIVREHLRPGIVGRTYPRPEFARLEVERCDRWAICPVGRRRQQERLKKVAAPRIATRPGRKTRR
jgi:hypothetical protein